MKFPEDEIEFDRMRADLISRIMFQMSEHNWSMKVLSDESGIPYETLKKLLNGKIKNPSFGSVLRIAIALDCSLDFLVLGRERA